MNTGRSLGLILLFLALFVLFYFAGDYMLAATLKDMRAEGLIPGTEETWRARAGLLKTVPGVIGIVLSIVWGVLADKIGRPRLVFLLGMVMGLGFVAIGASSSYLLLFLAMTIMAIAKIGIGPVVYAMVSDVTPPEKRGVGFAAYYAATVLGFIVGLVMGGILFYWRTAYYLTGILVIGFAVPLYLLTRTVTIGFSEQEPAGASAYSFRGALRAAMNRTVLLMMAQILPWTIPWGFITVFAVDYIMTRWGLSKELASLILAVSALSIAVGHVVGGKWADKLVSKGDILGRVRVSVIGIIVGYMAMIGMLAYPYPYGSTRILDLIPPTLLALVGLMFTTFAYPNISSVISECVRPEYRGTVFAFYNILNTLGWAIGPTLYGALVATLMSIGVAEKEALMYAAIALTSLWLASLTVWILLKNTYPRDRIS